MVVWYQSKVLWVNVIAIIALLAQAVAGFVISPEDQIAILAVVNLIVLAVTGGGLQLRKKK